MPSCPRPSAFDVRSFTWRSVGDVSAVARELSRRHMLSLSEAVRWCPGDPSPHARTARGRLQDRTRLQLRSRAHGRIALLDRHGPPAGSSAQSSSRRSSVFENQHARTFLAACEGLGLEPRECLHIGDSRRSGCMRRGRRRASDALWIDAGDATISPAVDRIGDVRDLPRWAAFALRGGRPRRLRRTAREHEKARVADHAQLGPQAAPRRPPRTL
jgi:hypothetical protein